MNEQREKYLHLFCCAEWLNEAWALLHRVAADTSNPLAGAALRFALVLYAKPYKVSYGAAGRRHKLEPRYLPKQLLHIHERVIGTRDQIHAHSDLTVMQPALAVLQLGGETHASISRRVLDPHEEMANIPDLIALIEGTLDNLYPALKEAEQALNAA